MPSYVRVSKRVVVDQFNAIDPATLSEEQAQTYRFFKNMEKEDFELMFGELYNPFRLSDRKVH